MRDKRANFQNFGEKKLGGKKAKTRFAEVPGPYVFPVGHTYQQPLQRGIAVEMSRLGVGP